MTNKISVDAKYINGSNFGIVYNYTEINDLLHTVKVRI